MATATVHHSRHATLSTTTVDTVSLTMPRASIVRVVNRNAASPLTFVVGRGTSTGPDWPADPTALMDDSLVVPPGGLIDVDIGHWDTGPVGGRGFSIHNYMGGAADPIVVKLIGSANEYSIYLFR